MSRTAQEWHDYWLEYAMSVDQHTPESDLLLPSSFLPYLQHLFGFVTNRQRKGLMNYSRFRVPGKLNIGVGEGEEGGGGGKGELFLEQ